MVYAGWIVAVIAAGLASRSPGAAWLPGFIAAYAGDTLWALMVLLILGFLFPSARTGVAAGSALGIAFAVEFSQLYQAEWINGIRATRIGALALGSGFLATDLVCYAVGVATGAGAEIASRTTRTPSSGTGRRRSGRG